MWLYSTTVPISPYYNFMRVTGAESKIKTDPFNPVHHIALAKSYLEEGDEERARKVVAIKRRLPTKDPSVHFQWGKLCEEIGMARQARESYEQAIALNPNNGDYHFRLALLYYEKGAWERTLKHLQKTVSLSPQNHDAKTMLATLYGEMGFKGSAIAVHGRDRKAGSVFQILSLDFSGDDMNVILDLFRGREFCYATYRLSATGMTIPSFIKGVLGFKEIREHLRGEETYGVYLLRADRTLKFTCIHVAIPWRKVIENTKNEGFLALLEQKIHQYARKIIEKSREYGISGYLENSGERDRRVWFFFEEFIPVELAERFLNTILDKLPAPSSEIIVTVHLGTKGKGIGYEDHPVMLPLGFNRRTGRRCFFVDEDGDPYEDQLLSIKKIRPISRPEVQSFVTSAEKGRYEWVHMDFDPLNRLEKNCPVIEEIIRKAHSGRMLRHEEKIVIFFTLGFLKDNLKSLHGVLEPCPDYRPKKVDRLASRLKSNPISCPKIRELLPETTAYLPCNCSFTVPEGGYPSPLLHIDPRLIHSRKEKMSLLSSQEELMKEYNAVSAKINELTNRRDELKLMLKAVQH
jgi:tetratricopeptide (TPR) repeat protein